jgi:prepilin-type N-terminal cleavage/methylation domain-containing protein
MKIQFEQLKKKFRSVFRRYLPISSFEFQVSQQKGFTLMEAIVSVAIFAFVMVSAMAVYLTALQIDSKTRAERAVQQNVRFITEFLGKEIRNGSIDYPAYGGTITYNSSGYTNVVHMVNQLNEHESVTCDPTNSNLILSKAAGATNLNSARVRVTRCAFYVAPATDPFKPVSDSPPNEQPFVTVVLQLEADYGGGQGDGAVMNLQTTFAVRDYSAREE